MDRLGIIPTSSAIALHLPWWLSYKHTNYLPEALPMRTSGLFIGKRPLYLRICPLFLRKCPLFSGKRPLFFGKRPLYLLENICCYWEYVPCFLEMSFVSSGKYLLFLRICPLFLGKRPLYLLKYRTLRVRFLRQSRLCMEGDNNWVINCKLRQSFALSRARVRAYRQEFNDFCCHICHMYILNHYVSEKYSIVYQLLTKRQS